MPRTLSATRRRRSDRRAAESMCVAALALLNYEHRAARRRAARGRRARLPMRGMTLNEYASYSSRRPGSTSCENSRHRNWPPGRSTCARPAAQDGAARALPARPRPAWQPAARWGLCTPRSAALARRPARAAPRAEWRAGARLCARPPADPGRSAGVRSAPQPRGAPTGHRPRGAPPRGVPPVP